MKTRPGPNDLLPHGTEAARVRHLAHGEQLCEACQVLDEALGYVARHAETGRQEVESRG